MTFISHIDYILF